MISAGAPLARRCGVAGSLVILGTLWIGYVLAGYPLLCRIRSFLRPLQIHRRVWRPRVTVVIAAYRETTRLSGKLASLAQQTYPPELIDLVVACDGGIAEEVATVQAAYRAGEQELTGRFRLLALPHIGKAAALNAGVAAARGEILVMTDARQRLSENAIAVLVDALADPNLGAVGGQLVLPGPSIYWRYESQVRRWEAEAGWATGVSGALYALRRSDWPQLPSGLLLDDVWVPLTLKRRGLQIAIEPAARAFDEAGATRPEFQRKVRTLSGNLQLLLFEPTLLLPSWPGWFSFVSHKLMRLSLPFTLLVVAAASYYLPLPWRRLLVATHATGFTFGLLGLLGVPLRLARIAATFLTLNGAVLVGVTRVFTHGRRLPWS